jgi:hypothetical protein
MALVDACVVRTAVRSLLVTPPNRTILSVAHSNRITAHILLLLLIKVENVSSLGLLLGVGSRRGDTARVLNWIECTHVLDFLGVSVPHEGIVVGVEFQLLRQLLLGHVHSLRVHASLISSRSQLCR